MMTNIKETGTMVIVMIGNIATKDLRPLMLNMKINLGEREITKRAERRINIAVMAMYTTTVCLQTTEESRMGKQTDRCTRSMNVSL